MQVVRRGRSSREWPLLFVPPIASHEDAAIGSLMGVAAAHDIHADRRLAIDTIVDSFQPMIEPVLAPRIEVEGRIVGELCFTREASCLPAVGPRTDDQPL